MHDFLWDTKYLVVLDKISTKEEWHTLKSAFLNSTNGSRIVLTTRYKDVASHVNQNSVSHQLRLQTKDESWDLFTQVVRLPSETSQPEISPDVDIQKVKKIAEKVVGIRGGLPLSILRLGYLLSGTKRVTSEELSRVLKHMDHNQTPWLETLELNEKDLPSYLRQCLSYFGLFPRDSEIPARRLVALWVAEGLAKPSGDELEPLESVAKKYLSELISRNLVQVVEKKLNGKVKRCGFPDTLRKLWLQRYPRSSLVQRLIICFDENDASSSNNNASSTYIQNKLLSCRRPPSMLYFDSREGNKPGEDSGNLLRKGIAGGHLLQLQVIDLEHVFRPQLPSTIRRLTHLTYLSLRWTFLETIPSSIGNLVNLQTLDVKHTYIRTLPSSIWKLLKLRHLYMDQIYRSKIEHHPRGSFLPNLQTLQGAFVDKDSPLKDGLHRLANLRKLILAFLLKLSEQEVFAESLLELKHLQFLKLKSIDEMGRPQDLMVMCLSGLEKLSSLYLFGKLDPSIIKDGFLQSLTELTLLASRLSDDPIPELEKLHNIKSLSLYSGSYIGNSMVCSIGGFPQLLVLKFWMLQELEQWTIEQQAMPKLKQLEIRSCKRLRVPTGLSHLKNLREL